MEYAWKSSIWIGIIISKSYKKAKDTIFDWQHTKQGQAIAEAILLTDACKIHDHGWVRWFHAWIHLYVGKFLFANSTRN